jgi:hypothetical protein
MLTLAHLSVLLWELVTDFWGQPIDPIFENRRLELGSYRLSRNVSNYQFILRDTPEERRSYLQGGGRLKCSECLLLLAQRTVLHSWGLFTQSAVSEIQWAGALWFVRTVGCERDAVCRSIMVCPNSQLWARRSVQEHYGLSAQSAVNEIQWAGALWFVHTVGCERDSVSRSIIVCPNSQLWARRSVQEHYGLSAQSAVNEIQW